MIHLVTFVTSSVEQEGGARWSADVISGAGAVARWRTDVIARAVAEGGAREQWRIRIRILF